MRLEKLEYSQFENEPREWKFAECTFEGVNLIVGKNATGKTRTLNVLRGLAAQLSTPGSSEAGTLRWSEGKYRAEFMLDGKTYSYVLEYHNRKVSFEELRIDGSPQLTRDKDGYGQLYAEKENKFIEFQTDTNRIAASAKRDAIQHSYLDRLHDWAEGVARYDFNTKLGKDSLLVRLSDPSRLDDETQINIKDTEKVIQIFLQGKSEYPNHFVAAILEDMQYLQYNIEDIGTEIMEGVILQTNLPLPSGVSGLYVKEADLSVNTQQHEMSDGMFRALSVLVQVNYALLSKQATCLLIDDIGEGLDYSRSSALVKRLIEKAEGSSVQLIMTTNDRFIMNAVPLEYWLILVREGATVSNLNYRNSKEMFDEFQYTGLNNFDLFSSGYYKRK